MNNTRNRSKLLATAIAKKRDEYFEASQFRIESHLQYLECQIKTIRENIKRPRDYFGLATHLTLEGSKVIPMIVMELMQVRNDMEFWK